MTNPNLAPALPPSGLQAFCDRYHTAYQAAQARTGAITHNYRIAGYTVRLIFAGSALVSLLTPALAHLAVADSGAPDFTLYLWDGASTGSAPPQPWPAAAVGLRGEVPTYSNEQILTAIQTDVNAVSVFDRSHGRGFYWIDSPCSLRAYERAAPLKVLLHWWLRDLGLPMIHAGAVGTDAGAVLLVGKSGAGKSTTTLACLEAGLHYLADDRCLLALEPTPQVYCIYNSAKLHLTQMERFPQLTPAVHNWHETTYDKALVHVHDVAPQQLALHLPIRALLLAKVAGSSQTTLAPVARPHLLRDFVTSSLVYQPGAAHDEVHRMTALVRQLPCYQINLGSDLAGIPPVITQVLQQAGHLSIDEGHHENAIGECDHPRL